ncbi:hypothetical protein ACLOJK_027360 [Asimina triloba]
MQEKITTKPQEPKSRKAHKSQKAKWIYGWRQNLNGGPIEKLLTHRACDDNQYKLQITKYADSQQQMHKREKEIHLPRRHSVEEAPQLLVLNISDCASMRRQLDYFILQQSIADKTEHAANGEIESQNEIRTRRIGNPTHIEYEQQRHDRRRGVSKPFHDGVERRMQPSPAIHAADGADELPRQRHRAVDACKDRKLVTKSGRTRSGIAAGEFVRNLTDSVAEADDGAELLPDLEVGVAAEAAVEGGDLHGRGGTEEASAAPVDGVLPDIYPFAAAAALLRGRSDAGEPAGRERKIFMRRSFLVSEQCG